MSFSTKMGTRGKARCRHNLSKLTPQSLRAKNTLVVSSFNSQTAMAFPPSSPPQAVLSTNPPTSLGRSPSKKNIRQTASSHPRPFPPPQLYFLPVFLPPFYSSSPGPHFGAPDIPFPLSTRLLLFLSAGSSAPSSFWARPAT